MHAPASPQTFEPGQSATCRSYDILEHNIVIVRSTLAFPKPLIPKMFSKLCRSGRHNIAIVRASLNVVGKCCRSTLHGIGLQDPAAKPFLTEQHIKNLLMPFC